MGQSESVSEFRVSWDAWLRWRALDAAFCYGYFPITFVKRVVLRGRVGLLGTELPARRFWDKWGFLPAALTAMGAQNSIWINMNSGGEVLIAWGLLKQLRVGQGPHIFSTESFDSYDLLGRTYGWDRTFFAPWDVSLAVRRQLRKLRPRALVFVQNAYFPVLLREAKRLGITTVLVNGLMRASARAGNIAMERSVALGYHHYLDAIAVQHESDYHAFREIGVPAERLEIVGDMYSDLGHLRISPEERVVLRQDLGLRETDRVLIVGSTHPREEPLLNEAFRLLRRKCPDVRFVVAPRQIQEAPGMGQRFTQAGWSVMLRSQLSDGGPGKPTDYDILLVDTFGELGRLYGGADVTYIGASLVPLNERRAGHNVLEPLAHGVIPVFGPHMNLWRHVTDALLRVEPTLLVDSAETLASRVAEILGGHTPNGAVRELGAQFIKEQAGAVERTLAFLSARLGA